MISLFNEQFVIKIGDITEENTDAIVNAANSTLFGGGGVDGAIHKKGGPKILEECKKIRETIYINGLPTSYAVATSGGNLKAKYVIHTVGPIWYGGKNNEEKLLYETYKNCMIEAEKLNIKTISFPFISTGAFGFPKDLASKIVYNFFNDYYKEKKDIISYLILFSQNDYNIFLKSNNIN
jgi:O-acetyl-ADP-ribose deacetylase (regulator of RNase III)